MADPFVGAREKPPQQILPVEENPLEADERAFEQSEEAADEFLEKAEQEIAPKIVQPTATKPVISPVVPTKKDEVTIEVEKILEQGLGSMYATLPESAKPRFKQKGEQAALEISSMARTLKFHAKRALQLIRDWLLTIPGVNKFFLEQEAKIKVDLVGELIEARKEDRLKHP